MSWTAQISGIVLLAVSITCAIIVHYYPTEDWIGPTIYIFFFFLPISSIQLIVAAIVLLRRGLPNGKLIAFQLILTLLSLVGLYQFIRTHWWAKY